MTDGGSSTSLLILVIGASIILTMLIRSGFRRVGIPSIIGFIFLGFLIRIMDSQFGCLSSRGHEIFEFLATIGVITLLFRIGLESNVSGLIHQLQRASLIWIGGVLLSAALGFLTCFYLFKLEIISSLFVAIALTATSVGIPVGVWQEAKALKSEKGELLIDVAELDDVSGIVLMALLFSIVPVLRQESMNAQIVPVLVRSMGLILSKLFIFGLLCMLFSIYVEPHVTRFFRDIESSPDPMIIIVGIGIIIASIAGILGFSVAIGAFFAGLVFSRDPKAVKIDTSFESLYEFFSPFFFIGIGLNIDPGSLTSSVNFGIMLLVIAVVGKLIGHGVPAWLTGGWISFWLIGVSMIPRAEIAMIIMKHGRNLGDWAVSSEVFTAMVFVSVLTCIVAPILIRKILTKWQIERN